MAIDVLSEKLITFGEAARHMRATGAIPVSPSTFWRWYKKGIADTKLDTICVGRKRYTSVSALQRFFVAVTEAKSVERPSTGDRSIPRTAETRERLRRAGLPAD
jgi:hypothetical protein